MLITPGVASTLHDSLDLFSLVCYTYISESLGTYQVGFTLLSLGVSSGIMSMVYGRIVKYVPRFAIVLFGTSLNLTFIITLLIWQRVPSYAVIFAFAVGWGVADAVWNTMNASKFEVGV